MSLIMDEQRRVKNRDVCHQIDLVEARSGIKSSYKEVGKYAPVSFLHLQITDVVEHDKLHERIAWTMHAATS